MTQGWPLIGPSYTIDGFVEPMVWGASTYTVIRMPEGLVEAARAAGTRRVGGERFDLSDEVALFALEDPQVLFHFVILLSLRHDPPGMSRTC